MALSFSLTYGGVPFTSDTAKIIRPGPPNIPPGQVDQQTPTRIQQPEINLVDELNRLIPFHNLNDFHTDPRYVGKNLSALARKNPVDPNPEGVRISEWYYPTGATRWSVFRGLATSSQVKAMLTATFQPENPTPAQWIVGQSPARAFAGSTPALLSMKAEPLNPISSLGYTVESMMYMLPPRPLGETLGAEGLFLVTLVDNRYFFQYAPTSAFMTVYPSLATWSGYLTNLATALGITATFSSAIPATYTGPEPDSQLWVNMENCAILLDAVAYNLGCRVVRNLNGTFTLQRHVDASEAITANREAAGTDRQRIAGGAIFDSTPGLLTGSRANAINQVVPSSINITFPLYCPTNTPVPHFLNPRTITPQRPSSWYEDSYGDVYIQNIPLSTVNPELIGVVSATGVVNADVDVEVAPYVHTIHTTAKALVPNDGSLSLLNLVGIEALALQIATDYYSWQGRQSLDEVYPGTVAWQPEASHDIVWTYSERMRLASCRVTRTIWNSIVRDMQHTTPPAPEAGVYTNNPPGVGGHSVAQSWKDSYASYIQSALLQSMGPTDTVAIFSSVDRLPTQNRWNAQIDQEIIQFDGTSGGILAEGGEGYTVTVAQTNIWNSEVPLLSGVYARGIESTIAAEHFTGTAITQQTPTMTHGANVVTSEKGQFLHPSDWGEGIQGVNIKPQTQTVFVWSASGVTAPNTPTYYSGSVVIANQLVEGQYQLQENIWVQERNANAVVSGRYYDGQLFGYSINPYVDSLGQQIPTPGAVNPIYLVNQEPVKKPPLAETAVITLTSTKSQKVKISDQANPDCEVVVIPGKIWQLTDCSWTAFQDCWFIQQNSDLPPLNIRIVVRLEEVDKDGIPIYFRETLPAIIQVTSLEQEQITLEDGSALNVFPGNVQILDNGKWVNVAPAWFFPLNGGEVPQAPYNYSCQVVSVEKDTGVEVWGTHLSDEAIISLTSTNQILVNTTGGGDGSCTSIVRPAEIWAWVGCTWQVVGQCYYLSVNSDLPPLKMRFLAKRVDLSTADNLPVYTKETLSAVIQVQSLTRISVKMDGKSTPVYQAIKQLLVQGQYTTPVTRQVWFTPLNSVTPSINRQYSCQLVGIDDTGHEIWGANPSDTAIISILQHQLQTITGTGNGSATCPISAMQAQRWRYDGCNWVTDGTCWYSGPNNDVPPYCEKFVARQIETEASSGLGVYSKEVTEAVVQVTSTTRSNTFPTCDGNLTGGAYPANVVSLENGSWVNRGPAWFLPLNNEQPLLNQKYSCQLVTTEPAGVGSIGVWASHLGNQLTTENTNAPINITFPTVTIEAHNDMGNTKPFGRIFFSQVDATTAQLNWQGQRVFHDFTVPQGPEPDLNLIDGTYFLWSLVEDDPTFGTIDIKGDVNITAVLDFIIQYLVSHYCDVLPCLEAKNDQDPINDTKPVYLITANNDLGNTKPFGRIFFIHTGDNSIDVNWQGLRLYHQGDGFVGPAPDIQFKDSSSISWTVGTDASTGTVTAQANTAGGGQLLFSNNDCTFPLIWPSNTMKAAYAKNQIGGQFDDSHDFGHILWKPATNLCTVQGAGGPGGYFSWQGIRLGSAGGSYVGPGEDIILTGTKCPQGTQASINVAIGTLSDPKDGHGNVQATFNTIGCTGTFYISYLSNVTFDADTCFLTPTYTRLIVTLNCGLIVNVQCSQDSQGGCNVTGLSC